VGSSGYVGSFGYTGSTGYTGSFGYTGSAGYTGSLGYTGSIGYTGSQSYTGSQGVRGFSGSQGEKGTPGTSVKIVGSVGYAGDLYVITGNSIGDGYITQDDGHLHVWDGSIWIDVGRIIGYTGSQGLIGYTGSSGYVGSVGFSGSQGYTGSQGAGFTGSFGYVGSRGLIGYSGSSSGFTGSVGYIGSQGPIGYSGSSAGFTGSAGYQGRDGYVGSAGYQGRDGYVGSQGIPGQYIIDVQAGVGVTVSGINSGTVSTATISIGQDVSTTATVTFTNVVLAPAGSIQFQQDIGYSFGDASIHQTARAPIQVGNYNVDRQGNPLNFDDLRPGDTYYEDQTATLFVYTEKWPTIYDLAVTANPGDMILVAQNIPGQGVIEFMTAKGAGIDPYTTVTQPLPVGPDVNGNWIINLNQPVSGTVTTATFYKWEFVQVS
jgi:hypothetical protein